MADVYIDAEETKLLRAIQHYRALRKARNILSEALRNVSDELRQASAEITKGVERAEIDVDDIV